MTRYTCHYPDKFWPLPFLGQDFQDLLKLEDKSHHKRQHNGLDYAGHQLFLQRPL